MRRALLLAAILGLPAAARGDGPPAPSAADVQFFEQRVRPLLVERCHGCHSAQAKKVRGGLLLDSRDAVFKGGDSGPVVVPGQPDKSLLVRAVRYQDERLQMPPKGKLPDREVTVLEEWVRRGVPFPGSAAAETGRRSIDLAEGRKFWSFQPPRIMPLPAVRDRDWPRQRLDAFMLTELEKHGLGPSPPAPRRVLIRRAYFDLVGLPPTPEEVEAFVNDPRPDAYERLVDRLLASPQYGERWARFWLDLSRYADVGEAWTESQAQPWLYRDWVVRALNEDMPYDEFVVRQLAADLLPGAGLRDRAALGFLGLSPQYWKELKLDKDVIKTVVAEEWEERIDALGRTFLGLTVACARCHDHKFDPITQQDYYAVAGVLASIRLTGRPVEPVDFRLMIADFRLPNLTPAVGIDAAFIAFRSKIANQKSNLLMAPAVEDASLYVLADGPHRTKLEYRPGVAQDVCVQVRGNPTNLGPAVPRRFLAVLSPGLPRPFTQGSGRLELAQALVKEGATLTARVIVNRTWRHHFGAGLVETPSDFGAQGARPSHPELLDDLTARFVAAGWSLKWLHREIMLSATYRQASRQSAEGSRQQRIDPDNRFFWRMNRRRLEVEAWRDAMLAAAGNLDLRQGGPPAELSDPKNQRRTLYGTIHRRELTDLLRLHDVPDANAHSPMRVPTTTPLQQLFVLNSPFLQRQAAALARRLRMEVPNSTQERIRLAYQLLYGRPSTQAQAQMALAFLETGDEPRWQQLAQVLLGSNEFLFVD